MINEQLINPKSIVIVGGSNDIKKPGGKIVKNIIDGAFQGSVCVVNQKETQVQGLKSYKSVQDLDQVDLAIVSVPSKYCTAIIKTLAEEKATKAFIVLSAGFAEAGDEGKKREEEIVQIVEQNDACLIGPNCVGVLNLNYNGIFTLPIPNLDKKGCDLISSSGATAVFLMEAGIPLGLTFSNVYSLGNGAQVGIEEVLEYMDLNYDPVKDSNIKLLYMESIKDPQKLLKHASSLTRKGAKIAAIKSGTTPEGSRAAASHTGAITSSDVVVRSIFQKAGIVYCSSREELLSIASIFTYKEFTGENIAVITHAGGSAVMITDALSSGGLKVPKIQGADADKLLSFLHPGSSVANPIDFLATGTAEQLGIIIDYCEHKFDEIDAMVVVFGSPGLFDVKNVYDVLSVKLEVCSKPIYPVLPSLINAQDEIQSFLSKGHINFPDEVVLGRALTAVYNTPAASSKFEAKFDIDESAIRSVIDNCEDGFIAPSQVSEILDASGIPRTEEFRVETEEELVGLLPKLKFPIVMKVIGPVHKTDVGGVKLGISNDFESIESFNELISLKDVEAVLIQPMVSGIELFAGASREGSKNHVVLCGLGGIFIEVLNDVSACITPVSMAESYKMIESLRGYKLLQGVRGKEGVNIKLYSEIIQRLSLMLQCAPEIAEMDINPLMGSMEDIVAVDTRIRIER